ncbi:hypothetical protein Plec18167_006665 [Paecilomyces lecythidis]|uniref:BTB domain transcription factor n=1 Tax=Paecilomyces lecythidis TaxID=3004212 RepID=A0ABR3XA42_9EURO
MAARTSTRQAAQRANQAITGGSDSKAGAKRRGSTAKAPAAKRGKKGEDDKKTNDMKKAEGARQAEEDAKQREETEKTEAARKEEEKPAEEPKKDGEGKLEAAEGEKAETIEQAKPKEEPQEKEGADRGVQAPNGSEAKDVTSEHESQQKEPPAANGASTGLKESKERENIVPSNILEKGIIYFFFRPRVNVEEPESINEVARSFFVLRPTPLGATLDKGPVEAQNCRLLILPKKKFPTSGKERDMGFVEKAGMSMKDLHEKFIEGGTYETSTRGERTKPEAKPYAEGVYAITSTKRASHLAYVVTAPSEIGDIQHDFGLHKRGSWILQSKNPKFPGPAQLPKNPEYPENVKEKFGDYRWIPLEPELINYPNAQFLMIGEGQDEFKKAASAEPDGKQAHEEQPGEEVEKLEEENEERIEALGGDHAVYEDLGLEAEKYPQVPTTWNA